MIFYLVYIQICRCNFRFIIIDKNTRKVTFFIHKSLLQDEYLKEVAVKETKTITSAEEKKLKEQVEPIKMMPV